MLFIAVKSTMVADVGLLNKITGIYLHNIYLLQVILDVKEMSVGSWYIYFPVLYL
jgi:hypothetical protein